MRNSLGLLLLLLCPFALVPAQVIQAQTCAAPGPCGCTACQQRNSSPRDFSPREAAPRGYYSRSPDSGEFSGENNSIGVRGFGIRMPSISLELPELRLPSLARYRRGPFMTTDSARAPWVEGRALEFNPVGPDRERDTNDRSISPPVRPRDLPSCVAPAARSCDAPDPAPGADARYREDSGDLNAQDQQLQLLREQAVSLQKAIDSLSNNRKATVELTERQRLRRKEQEVEELRYELQRMRTMISDNQTQSSQEVKTSVVSRNQTGANIRQVSAETASINRSATQPCLQSANCNGQECKNPNAQPPATTNSATFERPIVTKRETASRFKPSSIFGR